MSALDDFAAWLAEYRYADKKELLPPELALSIHSRSDEHSKMLAKLVLRELVESCTLIQRQAADGLIGFGVNYKFSWSNGKSKTLDLVVGLLESLMPAPLAFQGRYWIAEASRNSNPIKRVLLAVELKSALTEHKKSQPRIFDELNGSHAIVHAGDNLSVAGGLAMVNIASQFVSPLRQRRGAAVIVSHHDQPRVAEQMIHHLQNLPQRTIDNPIGFDAYSTFLIDVDNLGTVALWQSPPAPQPGDRDHFDTFVQDLCRAYSRNFGDLNNLPLELSLSYEEALVRLSGRYPGLLNEAGELAVAAELEGSIELQAILKAIEQLATDRSSQI